MVVKNKNTKTKQKKRQVDLPSRERWTALAATEQKASGEKVFINSSAWASAVRIVVSGPAWPRNRLSSRQTRCTIGAGKLHWAKNGGCGMRGFRAVGAAAADSFEPSEKARVRVTKSAARSDMILPAVIAEWFWLAASSAAITWLVASRNATAGGGDPLTHTLGHYPLSKLCPTTLSLSLRRSWLSGRPTIHHQPCWRVIKSENMHPLNTAADWLRTRAQGLVC